MTDDKEEQIKKQFGLKYYTYPIEDYSGIDVDYYNTDFSSIVRLYEICNNLNIKESKEVSFVMFEDAIEKVLKTKIPKKIKYTWEFDRKKEIITIVLTKKKVD